MMLSESLEQEAFELGLEKHRVALSERVKGVLIDKSVLINSDVTGYSENFVFCHEIEHKLYGPKNLLLTPEALRSKIEARVSRNTFLKLVPLDSLAFLYLHGTDNLSELADALEIGDEDLFKALEFYNDIYGGKCSGSDWVMTFCPFTVKKRVKKKNGA